MGGKISFEHIKKENLTKEELLFLYLLKYDNQKENYLVKDSITENGIHKACNCTLGLISRILIKNEKNGYIFRKKVKIINKKNKQYAFFLTESGLNIALEIKDKISLSEFTTNKFSKFL